jgi:hypothetical protein
MRGHNGKRVVGRQIIVRGGDEAGGTAKSILAAFFEGVSLIRRLPPLFLGILGRTPCKAGRPRGRFDAVTGCMLPGKAMARTGLRMMPMFPLPPLKFRKGFPRGQKMPAI